MKKMPKRIRQICECLVRGLNNREISEELDISYITVKLHVSRALKLFRVKDRTQLVIAYLKEKKMLDEYNYEEQKDERSQTLTKVIDKLAVAVEALKQWDSDIARTALAKIKEPIDENE